MLNTMINLCITAALAAVILTDFKWRIISNTCLAILAGLGLLKVGMLYGTSVLLMRILSLITVFLICFMIGYYQRKKDTDLAGGGDYKLISAYALLFGMQGLFLCLVFEIAYEIIYRYILFPERKKEAIPLGVSFGMFGIILILLEGFS